MNAEKYGPLEHTSDIGLEACGRDYQELLANLASGMFSLMTDLEKIAVQEKVKIELTCPNLKDLIVDWLNELIFLMDARGFVFSDFQVAVKDSGSANQSGIVAAPGADVSSNTNRYQLLAEAGGEKFDPAKHPRKIAIKAVTYHQLSVEQTPAGWQAKVFFDV